MAGSRPRPFEADDALDRLAASAQDDDPDIRLFPYRAGECQSVLTGQYQVEDHKIDWGLRHDPAHPGTVLRGRNPVVALARQIFLDQGTNLGLIIDDQDVTVVQLRLPHIMVRPRRQLDGQVPPDGSVKHPTIYSYKLLRKIGCRQVLLVTETTFRSVAGLARAETLRHWPVCCPCFQEPGPGRPRSLVIWTRQDELCAISPGTKAGAP